MRWEDFSGYTRFFWISGYFSGQLTQYNYKGLHKREVRRSKSVKGDVWREPRVRVMWFEDGERGNEFKNAGGL